MLQCTTLQSVVPADSRRTFFWSEIVTLHVTIAFNPNASAVHKTELHTQHGGATVADAWTCAALRMCEAALVSTTVTATPSQAAVAAASSNSVLMRPPSSATVMMGTRQRQRVEPTAVGGRGGANDDDDPLASSSSSAASLSSNTTAAAATIPKITFDVTFSIPYSSSAATADAGGGGGTTDTMCFSSSSCGANPSPVAAAPLSYYLCEWEVLLLVANTSGPSRAPMQHCDVFALLRHTVPVSSALLVSSTTVSCNPCALSASNASTRRAHVMLGASSSSFGTGAKVLSATHHGSQQQQQQPAHHHHHHHRVITVQCRNCCEHHVKIQHVELENSMWLAVSTLHQQTSTSKGSAASTLSSPIAASATTIAASNPWIVRHRNPHGAAFSLTDDGSNNNKQLFRQQQQQPPPPQLMALCDPLPITLKPSECYTFCFEYYAPPPPTSLSATAGAMGGGDNNDEDDGDERLQLVARTTIAGRPVLVNHTLKL